MKLVILGMGYSAAEFARQGGGLFDAITATTRSPEKAQALRDQGIDAMPLDGDASGGRLSAAIEAADALLVSVPAEDGGDPALPIVSGAIRRARALGWIGYLSTVGVYGDHAGAWVDETSELRATSRRGLNRIAAERAWLELGEASGTPTQIFRLAGIYGPGRNQLQAAAAGTARRIVKPGQMFSRIHVEDIAGACLASLKQPEPGAAYNLADDEPAPPQDVVAFAANLLGLPIPPEEPFDTAELSPMARSFYLDSRRVSNRRLRDELGYALRYPTYREGLGALLAAGEGR